MYREVSRYNEDLLNIERGTTPAKASTSLHVLALVILTSAGTGLLVTWYRYILLALPRTALAVNARGGRRGRMDERAQV